MDEQHPAGGRARSLDDLLTAGADVAVRALRDPLYAAAGHDPRSSYAETYWLPVLGPTTYLLARRLTTWLSAAPDGLRVDKAALGGSLGVGSLGRHAPLTRSFVRLGAFGLARLAPGEEAAELHVAWPPLAGRHLQRLPGYLARAHEADQARAAATAARCTHPAGRGLLARGRGEERP